MNLAAIVESLSQTRLRDPEFVSFQQGDVLRAVNTAIRAVVSLRPDATALIAIWKLSTGVRQVVPNADFNPHRLLDVVRNMGADGATPGDGIPLVEKGAKDGYNKSWMAETALPAIDEWLFDDRNPLEFLVSPPSDGTGYVEAMVSVLPLDIDDPSVEFPLKESYLPAIEEYALYILWGGDRETSPNYQRGQACFDHAMTLLGVKVSADVTTSPKTREQLK